LKNAARPQTKFRFDRFNDVPNDEINRFVSHRFHEVVNGLLSLFLPWHVVTYYRAALRRSVDAPFQHYRSKDRTSRRTPAPADLDRLSENPRA